MLVTSKIDFTIAGHRRFKKGEKRDVSDELANILSDRNLVEIATEKKESKSESKRKKIQKKEKEEKQ